MRTAASWQQWSESWRTRRATISRDESRAHALTSCGRCSTPTPLADASSLTLDAWHHPDKDACGQDDVGGVWPGPSRGSTIGASDVGRHQRFVVAAEAGVAGCNFRVEAIHLTDGQW